MYRGEGESESVYMYVCIRPQKVCIILITTKRKSSVLAGREDFMKSLLMFLLSIP